MAPLKYTFMFELTTQTKASSANIPARETGWTESFLGPEANVSDFNAPIKISRFATARVQALANQGKILGCRLHDLANNQTRSILFSQGLAGTGGDCTLPQVAVLARLNANNGLSSRAYEMRGTPDHVLTTGELNPGYMNFGFIQQLFNAICSSFGMIGIDRTNKHFKVQTVGAGGAVITKDTIVGINVGDTVQFYRTKFDGTCCGGVGQYLVTGVGAKSLTVMNWPVGKTATGGKVAKWVQNPYAPFDQGGTSQAPTGWEIERSVIRKSGRPFDLFSGKKSKKCCQC